MDLNNLPVELRRQNGPVATWSPHPLLPAKDRKFFYAHFLPYETIGEYIERVGLAPELLRRPVRCTINGIFVPRTLWEYTRPKAGTIVRFYSTVHGGNDKDPLRTILTIAVMVAALQLGPIIGGPGIWGQVWTAAISVVGGLAINALFPPPQLKTPDGSQQATSPSYQLIGGSNRARPYEPIPAIMGTFRVYPDLGATPYTEFRGTDQYLNMVFDFGYNDVDLSDYRIGDTAIDQFSGVELEESAYDGALDLFPGNVDTVTGGVLTSAGGWVSRTSSVDATSLAVEIDGSLYGISNDGTLTSLSCIIQIQYAVAGSGSWVDCTFESDAVPSSGTAGTGWAAGIIRLIESVWANQTGLSAGQVRLINNTRDPLRRTFVFKVPKGQYDVRVLRVTADSTSSQEVSETTWTQLRTYQPDTADYTGRKRVALRIKANGQLNGIINQFSALVSAKTNVWNGSSWDASTATSNPAWWFLQTLRGQYVSSKKMWGGGLDDSRIDIEAIKDFATWCDSKGMTFDGVFDQPLSVLDMLGQIALCGRGTVSWANGLYGVIWDADSQPVVGVFNMANIELNSFSLEYMQTGLADEIVLDFNDAALDYVQNTVRATMPGVSNPTNPRNIQLKGCTNAAMAGKIANLYIATNLYRTRKYHWTCDYEGMPGSRGDVIQLSHDLASFDYSGRFKEGGSTTSLKLSREVPLPPVAGYITIVKPDGSFATYTINSGSGNSDTLTPSSALPFDPWADPDHPPYDYKWIYGTNTTPGRLVKIDTITPKDETNVEVTAIDEDPNFYAAISNPYNYVAPSTIYGLAPQIENLALQEDGIPLNSGGYAVQVTVTWQATGNYSYSDVRVQINDGPLELKGIAVRDNQFKFQVQDGVNITVELTAYGNLGDLGQSTKVSLNQDIDFAALSSPSDVANFQYSVVDGQVVLTWDDIPDVDLKQYEVWRGTGFQVGTLVYKGRSTKTTDLGLPAGSYDYYMKAQDAADLYSTNATHLAVAVGVPGAPTVSASVSGSDYILTWVQPASSLPIKEYEIRYGASFAAGTSLGTIKGSTFKAPVNWSSSRTFWVAAINTADDYGTEGSVDLTITAPSAPTVTAQVLDNNVLLYWNDSTQTLPITQYEVRRGATYAGSTLIGTKQGWFTSVFETVGGTYTYWLTGIDSAGNYGAQGSVSVTVTDPPDYILNVDWVSTLSGTLSSAFMENGYILMPVNTTETWADHFVNNSFSTPQDQINAGYPYYLEPAPSEGYYEETFDYGTTLASTKVTVIPTYATLDGTPTVKVDIWISSDGTFGGTPDFPDTMEAYATSFRYIKVRFTVDSVGGNDLVKLEGLEVRLDSKLRTDQGFATVNSGDSGGTEVDFNLAFVDVTSINVTPQGTVELKPVVDFTDIPNPTKFYVYLFDAAGGRASGDVYWTTRGY